MSSAYQILLFAHVTIGFVSLITFWIPVLAKKGGRLHIRAGNWYAQAMYGVGLTAILLSALLFIDPIGAKYPDSELSAEKTRDVINQVKDVSVFLFAIALLTVTNVRTGLLTLRVKRQHHKLRAPSNLALNLALLLIGLYLAFRATGNTPLSVLFYIFSALCTYSALLNFRYIYKSSVTRVDQLVAHISNMIGAGIGAHTAFLLFGAANTISHLLVGYWGLVPWVLPGVVGGAIIAVQVRKIRRSAVNSAAKRALN